MQIKSLKYLLQIPKYYDLLHLTCYVLVLFMLNIKSFKYLPRYIEHHELSLT